MKIIRTLKVTQDEFFDCLEENLVNTVNKESKSPISISDIKKGLKYSKNEDDVYARTDFTILEYERGRLYKSKIKSMSDSIVMTYMTKTTDDGLHVTFEQSILSHETRKQGKFMKNFSELVFLSRMSNQLYDMQNKIFKKREGLTEKDLAMPQDPLMKHITNKLKKKGK